MEGIRELSAVIGVLLLLVASLWWLRHGRLLRVARPGGHGSRARMLQVVERAGLSPHHSLHLVRLAGRGLLIGVSPAGCTVLESFTWEQLNSSTGGLPEDRR